MDPFKIEELTDQELYEQLKYYKINCGPVMDTTRSLYENRLRKHLKTCRVPADYVIKRSPVKTPEPHLKTVIVPADYVIRRSPKSLVETPEPLPIINGISPIRTTTETQTPPEIEIIKEVKKSTVETTTQYENIETYTEPIYPRLRQPVYQPQPQQTYQPSPQTQKLFKPIKVNQPEFKLLRDPIREQRMYQNDWTNSQNFIHPEMNKRQIHHDSDYYSDRYEEINRRPLLNLDTNRLFKANNQESNPGLYSEPAPPQPNFYQPKTSDWKIYAQSIWSKCQHLVCFLILVLVLCMLTMYWHTSIHDANPIPNY